MDSVDSSYEEYIIKDNNNIVGHARILQSARDIVLTDDVILVPLEEAQEPEREMKEMQRPIQGFSLSPAVNKDISVDVVFNDNHLEGPSDTSSSGSSSSSSSCSGSSSESSSDEDSQADSTHDCEHHNPEEESQCEDVYSFKDDQENPMPSLGNNCSKKKAASIKVQLKCGKIKNIHDVNKPTKERKFGSDKVKCEQCGKRMMKKCLLKHKRRVHNYVTVKCGQCGKQMKAHCLKQHIQGVHNYVTVKCGQCGKQVKTHSLKQHIQEAHNYVTVKCGQCGKQVKKHFLKKHIQDAHNPKVKCSQCGKQVKKRQLRQHIQDAHNPKVKCSFCGKVYSERSLKVHKCKARFRSQGVKYEVLGKEKRKDYLRNRVGSTQEGTKSKVKCDLCQKEILKSNLARHKKNHREEFIEALIV